MHDNIAKNAQNLQSYLQEKLNFFPDTVFLLKVDCFEGMDLIHYSFTPLILFRVPYTLDFP